jgi:hypothetical protein
MNFLFLIYIVLYFFCPARGYSPKTLITVGFNLRINTTARKSPARDDTLFLGVKHNVANEF